MLKSTLLSVTFLCMLAFFLTSCLTVLNKEEEKQLKIGKTFWEWSSQWGRFNVHYIEKGEGPRHIILLHGFAAHSWTWHAIIDELVAKGYHVWAPDFLGFGLSDKPDNVPYGLDFFIEQLSAFMKGNDIEKANLVGNSMGGGIALAHALFNPEQVSSLCLLDALCYPMELPFYLKISQKFGRYLSPFVNRFFVRKCIEQVVYNKNAITEEQVEAYTLPFRLNGGTAATVTILQQFNNKEIEVLSRCVSQINAPTLIIWGEYDEWISVKNYWQFKQDLPHAETHLIPDCGHIPQEEEPEFVAYTLLDFLQRLDRHPPLEN